MKRTIIIIGGIGIICVLIGVWAYFLFFATPPEDGGIFANFNLGNTTDPSIVIEAQPIETEPIVDVTSPERLRQLTTQPVAGFAEVQLTASSTPEARYIEAGTGHIYSIDLDSGEEVRVSATTIPLTSRGVMSPNGQFVMLQSGTGMNADFVIGVLSTTSDELRNFAVPETITSFTATSDNKFLYASPVGSNLAVKVYDPAANTLNTLFTVPFRDATVAWHHTVQGPHLVYPHATSRLEGYLYSYTSGVATRLPASGFGLSAVGSIDGYIFSRVVGEQYSTFGHNKLEDETNIAPLSIIPDKCTFIKTNPTFAICGITISEFPYKMPDTWYKGEVKMNDNLWEYNIEEKTARQLISPVNITGRQIDIIEPQFGINDANLYFQNKLDQTLWMYEYNPFAR